MKDALARLFAEHDLRDVPATPPEPKDSASLIVIDRSGGEPKVLLGKRHAAHSFMPGKFVFPGGRIEAGDAEMTAASELHPVAEEKLRTNTSTETTPRTFALTAVRETFEETGLLVGRKASSVTSSGGDWDAFAQAGVLPALAPLHFVARAITPPGRTKRFDTRFFTVDASLVAHRIEGVVGTDSELTELAWVPIKRAETLDMPAITAVILRELEMRIDAGLAHELPVPFLYVDGGEFHRDEL